MHTIGPWRVGDVLARDEDRRYRHELVDGALLVSPAPGVRHQRASRRLANILDEAARAAGVAVEVLETVNVTVPSGLLIPDIAVVRLVATEDDPVTVAAEAVLLAVKIVSLDTGTKHRDRKVKPMLYAEAGIAAYWRLDFDPDPVLVAAELDTDHYDERTVARAGAVTRVAAPFPIELDPARLIRP